MLRLKLFVLLIVCVNCGGCSLITEEEKIFDFTAADLNSKIIVSPGDRITLICKYTEKENLFPNSKDYNSKKYCFSYVNDPYNYLKKIEDIFPGVYNLTFEKNGSVTVSSVTFPPFNFENTNVSCTCFTNQDEQKQKKVLTIEVNKTVNGTPEMVMGCDFGNTDPQNKLKHLEKITNIESNKICNVYNVKSGNYLALTCPDKYTVDNPKCFEHVNIYKTGVDPKIETITYADFEIVDIKTLLDNKKLVVSVGRDKVEYSKLPNGVIAKNIFFCMCKSKDGHESMRMNVYLNLDEEEAEKLIEKNFREVQNETNNYTTNSGSTFKCFLNNILLCYIFSLYVFFLLILF